MSKEQVKAVGQWLAQVTVWKCECGCGVEQFPTDFGNLVVKAILCKKHGGKTFRGKMSDLPFEIQSVNVF